MKDVLIVMVAVAVVGWAATTGELKRKKIALVFAAIALNVLLWFAFRTLRGLMALGYVDSAIVRVRELGVAEAEFARAHPDIGFTCTISQLPRNEDIARLANGGFDNGYAFGIAGCHVSEPGKPNQMYYIIARPSHSWLPAFCSDASGVLKADESGSVEKCLATGVPY